MSFQNNVLLKGLFSKECIGFENGSKIIINCNGGFHGYIQPDLALFDIQTLHKALYIEMKGKSMQAFRLQKNPFHMTWA